MSKSIVMSTPATVDLEPAPIPTDWILSGKPEARIKTLVKSHDLTSAVVVWECTAGRFNWHYDVEEAVLIISGEAFMVNERGEERRFGAGDMGFFPAGTTCTWRVDDHIRKVAVYRDPMWRPLGFGLKACIKLLRILGMKGKSALTLTLVAAISQEIGKLLY